jgi:hypothetical protein
MFADSFLAHKLSIQICIMKQVQALNLRMISNLNIAAPGVPLLPPAFTQQHPQRIKYCNVPPIFKLYLPTLMRSVHGYMHFARKTMKAMQGLILLICVS